MAVDSKIAIANSIVMYSTTSGKAAHDGTARKGGDFINIFCKQIAKRWATAADVMIETRKEMLETALPTRGGQLVPSPALLLFYAEQAAGFP